MSVSTAEQDFLRLTASLTDPELDHPKKFAHKHRAERDQLLRDFLSRDFPLWRWYLRNQFNVLCYGFGSHKLLLDLFAASLLERGMPCLVINGFFPSLKIQHILDQITSFLQLPSLSSSTSSSSSSTSSSSSSSSTSSSIDSPSLDITERCRGLVAAFQRESAPELHLVVHSITAISSPRAHAALALLATAPKVHIVASTSHLNGSLLWDNATGQRFRWVWCQATTFQPHLHETAFSSAVAASRAALGPETIARVLEALPPNAAGCFRVLAAHQVAQQRGESGMTFEALLARARERFLVSQPNNLAYYLAEFTDHHLVEVKKAVGGVDCYVIPATIETLKSLLQS